MAELNVFQFIQSDSCKPLRLHLMEELTVNCMSSTSAKLFLPLQIIFLMLKQGYKSLDVIRYCLVDIDTI